MGGGSGPAGESVAEAYSGDADPSRHHVLELGNLPEAAAALPDDQRFKLVRSMIKSSKPGGFATDSQTHQCSMPWYQEFACVLVLGLWLGGPLFFFFTPILLCMFGTWTQISYFLAVTLVLALHPLPNLEEYLNKSAFSMWLYKYFSYRIMWSGDAYDKAQASAPWVGAAGPHSVMPFGSVLSIPGINTFVFRKFKGGTASVLGRVPLLRYLYLWGTIDVAGKSLSASLKQGYCVGVVCDGIAGIFKCTREKEAFYLKNRKSLAKFCIRNGCPFVPAYSIGNSQCFNSWFDSFGLLEWLSRKTQCSLFLYWGRFLLPIPFRTNVTLLFGAPISVEKKDHPTEEEVDAVHQQMLDAFVTLFDTHKAALGWSHRSLTII